MRTVEVNEWIWNINNISTMVENFDDKEKQLFVWYLKKTPTIQNIIKAPFWFSERKKTKIPEKYKNKLLNFYKTIELELSKFKNIDGFDPIIVREEAMKSLLFVLTNEKIPEQVKENMLLDFEKAIEKIKKIDLSKIEDLKSLRAKMSFGLNKKETDGDILQIILWQAFTNEISLKASVIKRCFVDETVRMGKTEYHKKTLDTLKKEVLELDEEYGLNVSSIIKEWIEKWSSMKILDKILEASDLSKGKRHHIRQLFRIEDDTWESNIDISIWGKSYNLITLLGKYNKAFGKFRWWQNNRFTEIKNDILDEWNQWFEGKMENLLWLEKIDTDIDIDNQIQDKIDKMNLADLVIILNQLAGIAPVYGWLQDLSVAYTWVDFDGRLPSNFERSFLLVMGALDVSVAWSWISKLWKAKKLEKMISILDKIKEAFTRKNILIELVEFKNEKLLNFLAKFVPGLKKRLKEIELISKNIIDNFDNLPKSKKTMELLEKFPNIKPEKEIIIDGVHYAFSKVFLWKRPKVIWFVEVNWKIEPRLFYKSISDGWWRTTPGITWENKFSKADEIEKSHYVITTKIDAKLENFINTQIPKEKKVLKIEKYFKGDRLEERENLVNGTNFLAMQQEVKAFDDKELLSPFREGNISPWYWGRKWSIFQNMNANWVKKYLSKLEYPEGFLPNFFGWPKESYETIHSIAWPTEIDVFEGVLDGRKVEWHMARSKNNPEQIWISNIRLANGKLSSFGNDSEFLNTGVLTQKPFEYASRLAGQVPYEFNDGRALVMDNYYDITDVLWWLRPISNYKKYKLTELIPLDIWETVVLPRSLESGWGTALWTIAEKYPSGKVKVLFSLEDGREAYKIIDFDKLKAIPYKIWDEVQVPRNGGLADSLWTVTEFFNDGRIRVDFVNEKGENAYKVVKPSRLKKTTEVLQKVETKTKLDIEKINKETIDLFNNFPSLRYDFFSSQIFRCLDNMNSNGNPQAIKKAKALTREFLLNSDVSTETILHFLRTNDLWMEKLSGWGIYSLTHILESMIESSKIPRNETLKNLLKRDFGEISQDEFFAFVSLHHDLEKRFGKVAMIDSEEKFEDLFKGRNLSSHQLDSANLLRSCIKEWQNSSVYKSIESFLDFKWIDRWKTNDFIHLMADTIESHAGNTEFIQKDTISGLQKIWKKSVDMSEEISLLEPEEQKDYIVNFLWNLKKENGLTELEFDFISKQIEESDSLKNMIEIFNTHLISKYLKITIWKNINPSSIKLEEIEKLTRLFPLWVDKNPQIRGFLENSSEWLDRIEEIILEKLVSAKEHMEILDKYLHTREFSDRAKESARFAFNISDIVWYTRPSSESFVKLIGFNKISELITSPMDSAMASLSEIRFALFNKSDIIDVEEYKKIYEEWIENLWKLAKAYRKKMKEPIWDDAPQEIKNLGETFEEAYNKAIFLENESEVAIELAEKSYGAWKEAIKEMEENIEKTLWPIKAFFVGEFTIMCKNL